MSLIVRKYGGSSVASIDKIKKIAHQIKDLKEEGNNIIVVVSAMGKTTDNLLADAREISDYPDARELDMLLSIGERKSISLMSLALNSIGVEAVSYTGSQVGIITDNNHGDASIIEIKADRIKEAIHLNKVVVIAGYQGVSVNKEITTLGRGGTDTTAVAIAAALNADRCELMKDVDGLFCIPPKYYQGQKPRAEVSYNELIEIASSGAEIVAKNSIQIAKKQNIKLGIGNTDTGVVGTIIINKEKSAESVSQIVEQACLFQENIPNIKSNESLSFNFSKNQFYIDLNENIIQKKHVLLTILGTKLISLNLKSCLPDDLPIHFHYETNEKVHFVFELKDYSSVSKDIMNMLKNMKETYD